MTPAQHPQRIPVVRGSSIRRDTRLVPGQALLVPRLPWEDQIRAILLLECVLCIADGEAFWSAQCLRSSRILRQIVACGLN